MLERSGERGRSVWQRLMTSIEVVTASGNQKQANHEVEPILNLNIQTSQ
jgi:hypothetical protein